MKLLAFSIYDEKVRAFNSPYFAPSIGHAARSFGDAVNDGDTTLSRHPLDYSLYHVGEFDDEKAEFVTQVPPALVGRGGDFTNRDRVSSEAGGSPALPIKRVPRARRVS